jgi:hypothetical protein
LEKRKRRNDEQFPQLITAGKFRKRIGKNHFILIIGRGKIIAFLKV